MKIQTKKLSEIKPYWRNARNNEKTVEALKKSITEYGYNQPISIDKDGVIITGHARYSALLQLGHKEVPVVVLDHLSEKKLKEYRIADNKTHELTIWDNAELVTEMKEIANIEDMQVYFPNINLGNWLEDSVGFNLEDITTDQYNQKEEQMMNAMTEHNTKALDSTIDVMCPHCLKEFALNKKDLL